MRDDEQLTGDVAAKVTAAAQAKEPGATLERVETDSEGVHEAHMVREDGTRITVQIDKSYAVTNVQEGMSGGARRPWPAHLSHPRHRRPDLAACRLPPAACRLPPAACRLPPAVWRVRQAAGCSLHAGRRRVLGRAGFGAERLEV